MKITFRIDCLSSHCMCLFCPEDLLYDMYNISIYIRKYFKLQCDIWVATKFQNPQTSGFGGQQSSSTSHKSPHPMGFCENVPENILQLCPGRISLARILHVVLVQQVVQRPEEGWHEVRWLRYTNSDELRLKSIPPLVSNNGG